jgi:hypothetical protein
MLAPLAPAQSDSVTVTGTKPSGTVEVRYMTDSAIPEDFGTDYPLGQLVNGSFSYGSKFIIEVSYTNLSTSSISVGLSGSQPDYLLAWRADDSTEDNGFEVDLGADVVGLSGDGSGYYRQDGTLQLLATDATRYRIGASSTTKASIDLSQEVTLTVTRF